MKTRDLARLHTAVTREALAKHPWLLYLAQALLLADNLSAKFIATERARSGRRPACRPRCCECCRKCAVPVTRLEMQGISWYLCEALRGTTRSRLSEQLKAFSGTGQCPFLLDDLCGVRPVRPLSCRQFFVLDTPCKENEDLAKTRPRDILQPHGHGRERKNIATLMLQGLELGSAAECRELAAGGELVRQAKDMLDLDLAALAEGMDRYDSTK